MFYQKSALVSCKLGLIVIRPHPAQLLPHLHLIPVFPPVSYETSLLIHDKVPRAGPVSPSLGRLDAIVVLTDMRTCRFIAERYEILCVHHGGLSCRLQGKGGKELCGEGDAAKANL